MNPLQQAEANLPQYAKDYAQGLGAAILSDVTVTSLFLGAVARDKAVRRFFLGYAAARSVQSVANAIGHGLIALAQAGTPVAKPLPPQ